MQSNQFGDRKVIEREDSFIVTHRAIDFTFDNEIYDNKDIESFFESIDILLEYCKFGTKSMYKKCKNLDYYYNTKHLILYTPEKNFIDFEICDIKAYLILIKHGIPEIRVNKYEFSYNTSCGCIHIHDVKYPIYFPKDVFNDINHYKRALEDYLAIVMVLDNNKLVNDEFGTVEIDDIGLIVCIEIEYNSKKIILDTLFIRPIVQHILDEIQMVKMCVHDY